MNEVDQQISENVWKKNYFRVLQWMFLVVCRRDHSRNFAGAEEYKKKYKNDEKISHQYGMRSVI